MIIGVKDMGEERENIALYLGLHPILKEPNIKKRKKYFNFLSYYASLYTPQMCFSEALMALYKRKILGEEACPVTPDPTISGLFKYRYILYMDVWFINAFDNAEKAEKLLNDMESRSRLLRPFRKKMRKLYERLYVGDNGISFPKVEQMINLWKRNETFAQEPIFKVAFTANMSAGKSTLINALVGKKINRSQNLACTAKLHYILSKPFEDGFISEDDHVLNLDADFQTLMTDDDKNSSDVITVSTYFRLLSDQIGQISFLDTPGVNSSLDQGHKAITHREISKGKFDVLIYVINANNVATDDENLYMRQLAETMSDMPIIFAVNKLDSFRSDEDDIAGTIEKIKEDIKKLDFKNAMVCPVSAYTGYLAKRAIFDGDLDEDETEELGNYRRLFQKEEHDLSRFYPVEIISACSKVIESEQDMSRRKYLQLLRNCGILPLEYILAEKNEEAHL